MHLRILAYSIAATAIVVLFLAGLNNSLSTTAALSLRQSQALAMAQIPVGIIIPAIAYCLQAGSQSANQQQSPAPVQQRKVDPEKQPSESESKEVEETVTPDETTLLEFTATAYSIKGVTATGIRARHGIIAADPRVLPIGSVVRIHAGKYSGIYTVLDTGASVKGRKIDVHFPEVKDAREFGRRKVKVQVLRYGWAPNKEAAIPESL